MIIIFGGRISSGMGCWSGIPWGLPTISRILSSTSLKTSFSACKVNFSWNRQIGVYSIALTILEKLDCLIKKNKKRWINSSQERFIEGDTLRLIMWKDSWWRKVCSKEYYKTKLSSPKTFLYMAMYKPSREIQIVKNMNHPSFLRQQ
jgi:hypothetical protein